MLPFVLDSKWTPRMAAGEWGARKCLKGLVDLVGFEPTTSSMPWKRAPNCATGPAFDPLRITRGQGGSQWCKLDCMTRAEAWEIVCEFVQSDALRRHALAVEACVHAYARKFRAEGREGIDEVRWSVTALLHDFDWEIHPQAPAHPMEGEAILKERGVDEEIRRAILSHAQYSGVPRVSLLEKTLFACDELAGFLTAVSYVKPGRSIHEVEAKGVLKKMKDKAFARAVSRGDIVQGAAELGVELEQHIAFCIEAMKACADELGLAGLPQSES